MRKDYYFDSCGKGRIHVSRWEPERQIRGIVQIVHGIAEYALRYDELARFLNENGILVVAEDHMGHGGSIGEDTVQGYFYGGWFAAVEDTYRLLQDTRKEFPNVPYILLGHSMGSFMARTILQKHPDSGISGAVICGTGWLSPVILHAGRALGSIICLFRGDTRPSKFLDKLSFGGYNNRIDPVRTSHDWLSRDCQVVDRYVADPLCGFMASAGLMKSMMTGLIFIQKGKNLDSMNKDLPVLFIAGEEDPVGQYGAGVRMANEKFIRHGMQRTCCILYPGCRHEIHNELDKEKVYADLLNWIRSVIG